MPVGEDSKCAEFRKNSHEICKTTARLRLYAGDTGMTSFHTLRKDNDASQVRREDSTGTWRLHQGQAGEQCCKAVFKRVSGVEDGQREGVCVCSARHTTGEKSGGSKRGWRQLHIPRVQTSPLPSVLVPPFTFPNRNKEW